MDNQKQPTPQVISGFLSKVIRFRIRLGIVILALKEYKSPGKAYLALRRIVGLRKKIHGNKFTLKYVRADNKSFVGVNVPGWPSKAFNSFIKNEFKRVGEKTTNHHKLHTTVFSITGRCSFRCEHCADWDNISSQETLSIEELKIIQQKLHNQGISHLEYSGGEPLFRMDALVELLTHSKADVSYWLLTSGFKLSVETAKSLKHNGLTGVMISLDHWDEQHHNSFRKNPKSFFWVREAVSNCREADLVTGLNICATKEFISDQNLWKYADLAKSWGVGFIRILEPGAVGKYAGKDVSLSVKHQNILEHFFLEINSKREHRNYPIVIYPGYHQRRIGCLGSGDRYIYIDSKGYVHSCPFCHNPQGNALKDDLNNIIMKLRKSGCQKLTTI